MIDWDVLLKLFSVKGSFRHKIFGRKNSFGAIQWGEIGWTLKRSIKLFRKFEADIKVSAKRFFLKFIKHDLSEKIGDFFGLFFIEFFLLVLRQNIPKICLPWDIVTVDTVIAFCLKQSRVVLKIGLRAHKVIDFSSGRCKSFSLKFLFKFSNHLFEFHIFLMKLFVHLHSHVNLLIFEHYVELFIVFGFKFLNLVWIDFRLFHWVDMVKNVGEDFVFQWVYRFLGIAFSEINERSEFSELWLKVLAGKKFVHLNFELIKKVFIFFRNLIGLSFLVKKLTDISFLFHNVFFFKGQFLIVLVLGLFFEIIMRVNFMLIHDFFCEFNRFNNIGLFPETFGQYVFFFFEIYTFFKGASGIF